MNADVILVTEKDYHRIKNLLDRQDSEDVENLELEIDRAKIISDDMVPADLVTMNSKVRYLNVQDAKESTVTLVYPSEARSEEGKISILAPLGAALLGLRVNQEINWMFPDGKTRTIRILEVVYQPEAHGHWHL